MKKSRAEPKSKVTLDTLAIMMKKGFDRVDERFIGIDQRFDSVENRLSHLEANMSQILSDIDNMKNRLEIH